MIPYRIHKHRRQPHSKLLILLSGAALSVLAGAAQAQTKPPGAEAAAKTGNELEEVLVTARRVEENIQNVPVAVTAISANALREQAIVNTTEIQFHAPSVQMTTVFGRLSGGFAVRGLTGGTSVYFAEIPGGPTESSAPFYDIGSVQVLNGPQGTLFGRANTAGAVVVTPNAAELNRFEGSFDAGVGSLGLNKFTAVLNVPLMQDQLAVRIAANRYHLDGYTKTLTRGEERNENNSENFRISALWKPGNGRFTVKALFDYYDVDQKPGGYVLQGANPTLALYNLPANINAPGGLTTGTAVFGAACNSAVTNGLSPNVSACIDERLRIASTFRPSLLAEAARTSQGGDALRFVPDSIDLPQRETLRKNTFVANAAYDFGDLGFTTLEVRNIFGYQEARGNTAWSVDGLGGLIQDSMSIGGAAYTFTGAGQQVGRNAVFGVGPYQKVYTNETQARGVVGDDLLSWTVGYFYQSTPFPVNLGGIRNLSRVYSGITLATRGFNPSFNFTNGGYQRQKAGYGQATANLSSIAPFFDSLHVTGGIRKSYDESELRQLRVTTNIATGAYVPGEALAPARTKSNGYNSNLSLEAGVTPDLLVYLARRTGYRPGGLNTVTNSAGLPSFTPAFSPEKVKDIEFGAKYDFTIGDINGRLNGALYKTDYSNIQVGYSAAVNGVTATYVVNAAAAQIKGLELQGQMRAWGWDVSGTYAYTDAAYKKFIGPDPLSLIRPGNARCLPPATTAICLLDLSFNPFPFIPKHQASLNVRYTLPLDEALGPVTLGGSMSLQSRRYFGAQAGRQIETYGPGIRDVVAQKYFERYNLRADWKNIHGSSVSVAAFVNNVTDVTYKLSTVTQLHSLGNSVSLFGEPRTYGVEFRYEFGR